MFAENDKGARTVVSIKVEAFHELLNPSPDRNNRLIVHVSRSTRFAFSVNCGLRQPHERREFYSYFVSSVVLCPPVLASARGHNCLLDTLYYTQYNWKIFALGKRFIYQE